MPDSFSAYNAFLHPEKTILEGWKIIFSAADFEKNIQKIAAALTPLKKFSLPAIGVDITDPIHHFLILLALARLDLPACSLFLNENDLLDKAIQNLELPIIIATEKKALQHQTEKKSEYLILDQKWFDSIFCWEVENHSLSLPDFKNPSRIVLTGLHDPAFRFVFLGRGWVRQIISQFSWICTSLTGLHQPVIFLSTVHLTFLNSFLLSCGAMAAGLTLRFYDPFHPEIAFTGNDALFALMTPEHLALILDNLQPSAHSEIFLLLTGGNPDKDLIQRCCEHFTPNLWILYATEETGPISMAHAVKRESVLEAGAVFPWVDIQITDNAGQILPYGQKGNICLKIPDSSVAFISSSLSQKKDWSGTEAKYFKNGFFLTGDYGYLTLSEGRKKLWIEKRPDHIFDEFQI